MNNPTYQERVQAVADGLNRCKKGNKYKWFGIIDGAIDEARNKFFIIEDTCFIELKDGYIAQFDREKFNYFKKYRWVIASRDKTGKGYVCSWINNGIVKMHHLVLGKFADHIDRDRLNNKLSNLRILSHSDNLSNVGLYSGTKNLYKGVYRRKNGTYYAQIIYNKKLFYIGSYSDPVDAAMAYDEKLVKFRGASATTNKKLGLIPDSGQPEILPIEPGDRMYGKTPHDPDNPRPDSGQEANKQ